VEFNAKVKKQEIKIKADGNAKEKKKKLRKIKNEYYKYKEETRRTMRQQILQQPFFITFKAKFFIYISLLYNSILSFPSFLATSNFNK